MSEEKPAVIIYSTNWCAYCKMARQYLMGLNVPVVEKNIEEDEAAHTELMNKIGGNFRGVPVIDINGDIILGFDRAKIDDSLKRRGEWLRGLTDSQLISLVLRDKVRESSPSDDAQTSHWLVQWNAG